MYVTMLRRDPERNGLRIARASWLVGVTVHEYREIEAGTKGSDRDTYSRRQGSPNTWRNSADGSVARRVASLMTSGVSAPELTPRHQGYVATATPATREVTA